MSQKILQYVEIDCDYCSLTYGVQPCAANNTPTGVGSKLLLHMLSGGDGLRDFSPAAHGRPATFGSAGLGGTGANLKFGTSCAFPGVNQFFQFPDSPDWNLSQDFTIDFWFYNSVRPAAGQVQCICSQYGGDNVNYWLIVLDQNGAIYLAEMIGGTQYNTFAVTGFPINQWGHFAFVRSAGMQTGYFNGVAYAAPVAVPVPSDIAGPLQIGAWATANYFLNGYLDELRITPYAAWKSNFTPPTAEYSEDPRLYNRLVLHCDGPSLSTVFPDSSVAAHGNATVVGNTQMSVSTYKFGTACAYFDGASYLTFANSPDWDFGDGDFTIDWWEYRTSIADGTMFMVRDAGNLVYQPFLIGHVGSGVEYVYASSNQTSWDIVNSLSLGSVATGVWSHRAVCRQGNTFIAYKDGVQTGSVGSTLAIPANTGPLSIGRWFPGSATYFPGYLDELRISKFCRFPNGTTFTPPTVSDNAPTGTIKCFNTKATCQDRLNFTNAPTTFRFAVPTADLPTNIECIPNIKQIQFEPATISLGHDLGQRATLTVSFEDHKHSDTGPGGDKYASTRGYNPYSLGTFWGKFRARQPFLFGKKIRWITGNTDQALADMETRNYIIESSTGPDGNGVFKIIAKDVLKLADGERATAPNLSNGFLTSAITNSQTTMTVSPTGVGATYPASGYANIGGSEIVLYSRSGDSFTITRGQLGTPAVAHSGQDRVQLTIHYQALSPEIIINDLLVTYAGVPGTYIPYSAWVAEITTYLNRVYTATIANPTPVSDLLSELCEQAGLSLWWDDRNQRIGLQVLRGLLFSNFLFDENSTIADTLQIEEQPTKRLSQVHTYFGQINPLTSLTDAANYRSSSFVINAQKESDYGTPAIKEIFSRWIPAFGRTIADRLGSIILARYQDPPRKFSLSVLRNSTPEIIMANGYQVSGWPIQDQTGAPYIANAQVIRVRPNPDTIEIEAEEVLYTAPAEDLNLRAIIIDSDTQAINFRTIYDALFPAPTAGIIVLVTINSGVKVSSPNTGTWPVQVGSWPAGVTIIVDVQGHIRGAGGAGGPYYGAGAGGGPAFYTSVPIKLACTGTIWGGGGGGGGSQYGGSAGGGGAGIVGGLGGVTLSAGYYADNGTETTGGRSLSAALGYQQLSGDGGGPGQPGMNFRGQQLPSYPGYLGGAAGYSIYGVSLCTTGTWDGTTFTNGALGGDIRGPMVG